MLESGNLKKNDGVLRMTLAVFHCALVMPGMFYPVLFFEYQEYLRKWIE